MSQTPETDEKAEEAIKQLASSHGADPDDLREEYAGYLQEERDKDVSNPVRRAIRRLSLSRKGSQMAERERLRGHVFGVSDPINTSASDIRRVKNAIENQGIEKVKRQGMIKRAPDGGLPDGLAGATVTTDEGEKEFAIVDTQSNSPTHGEILPSEDYIRYVYGAVWRSSDDGPHLFSGVLSDGDESEEPPVPPMREPVVFEAAWLGESDQNNTIRLRFDGADPFEADEDFGGPSPLDIIEGKDVAGVTPLEAADTEMYDRNDVFVTKGSVTYMELAPDEGQSRRLTIVDPFAFDSDLSRTVWLPEHTTVDFKEDSDVFVVGQPSRSTNEEYPDSIEAVGVFPHPDYKVDRSGVESMADDGGEGDGDASGEPDTVDSSEGGGSVSPADAGAELKDPSEVGSSGGDGDEDEDGDEDVEFKSGNDVEEPDSEFPPVIADANYTEMRAVAGYVDEVPGSGISEPEIRAQLTDALGVQELTRRLIEGPEPEGGDQEAGDDGGEPDDDQEEAGDEATEPDDEDDDWEW